MKVIGSYILFSLVYLMSYSQKADLKEIIKVVANESKLKKELFALEYKGTPSMIIHTDTVLQKMIPRLKDDLLANRFLVKLTDEDLNVYITSDLMYHHINYFVVLDKIDIKDDEACLKLHTTSLYVDKNKDYKYIKADIKLIKQDDRWKVVNVKKSNTSCCDKIWGDIDIIND